MSELKKYKLGDLGFFFGGVTSIKQEDYGFGTPFLPYKNVYKNSKVNINELELMNVRPQDVEKRSAIYGDIFFTASSETPDEVAMSSVLLDDVENLTFNGFCKRFRLNNFKTLLPEYARYLFRDVSFRREVYQLATGDIRFNISQESLANIEIEIPDIKTQREIAQILTSLDDKIELNLQMNQTLEAMAQAIFKEWFVDFKFHGFDGQLVNGLPKGWRIGSLSEIISFVVDNRGKTPNTLIEKENNYPLIEVNSLINSRVVTQQHLAKKYVDEETYNNWFRKGHPQKGDVLFSTVGSIGEISLVFDEKFCIAQNIIALRSFFNGSFLFFALKNLKQSLLSLDISSVQPSIKVPHLLKSEILIPNDEIIKAYEESILPIIEKINENSIQIQTLTQTRDALLPKLMCGKIEEKKITYR